MLETMRERFLGFTDAGDGARAGGRTGFHASEPRVSRTAVVSTRPRARTTGPAPRRTREDARRATSASGFFAGEAPLAFRVSRFAAFHAAARFFFRTRD